MSAQNTKKETYEELKAQAEAILQRAEEVRKEELAEVIADMNAKIEKYDITAKDLKWPKESAHKKESTGKSKPNPPKYKDPVTGATWTGKGQPPSWIAGKDREPFLIRK
ncbi:H-NS family nucleoid-associated regulatory protein [Burkholderia sp. S171]|uniref:H-NS histone family protein n=1 Tax=Burkholderia sp. S171 TaxID=1641860 RepID=UPI00131BFC29|nr:H-NS histone family protein [Burkholderia sp. S171]